MDNSFFSTAVAEYVTFCNKQGISARNVKDCSIDVANGDILLMDKNQQAVAKLNKDFAVTSIIHGVRT
tara:strand:+ start:244 stop:447 length:204 start_codon:yes stop_codon:yes gene_type:complete